MAGFFLLAGLMMWMMITGTGGVAWAKEPATPELTLQQAVEKALAASKSLKNAEYEVERTEEVRNSAADKVKYIPAPQSNPDPVAAASFTGLVSADLQWQMAKKSYDLTVDTITAAVTSAYYAVLQAQENVRVAEMG
ncbi:MAG: TolC family protein, partial [Desulfotomaculales bacterium]